MVSSRQDWSEEELIAAVDAYLDMLRSQSLGQPFSKAEYRRRLMEGPLSARNDASIEFRMQNISAAMSELCLPTVKGYLPARHVGNNVKDKIKKLIERAGVIDPKDYAPEFDDEALSEKVRKLIRRPLDGKPRGQLTPEKSRSNSSVYRRDPLVRAWVLQHAEGICECCKLKAPFQSDDGALYLEVHHVRHLSAGGSDRIENAVAVCPNCHRALHYSAERQKLVEKMLGSVNRLKRE